MKIISFAWTTPALLARRKTVTRREWTEAYAHQFQAGDLVAAYDKNPRNGGKQVATIRLLCDPYLEPVNQMPGSDYEAEGFQYFEEQSLLFQGFFPRVYWRAWKASKIPVWVIRFEVIDEPLR